MDTEIIRQIAESLKEDLSIVSTSVDFYEKFISDTIRSGRLQNIRIPQFGTFKVNMRKIKYMTNIEPLPPTKMIRRQGHKPIPKKYRRGK